MSGPVPLRLLESFAACWPRRGEGSLAPRSPRSTTRPRRCAARISFLRASGIGNQAFEDSYRPILGWAGTVVGRRNTWGRRCSPSDVFGHGYHSYRLSNPNKRTRDTVVGRGRLPRSIPIPKNTKIRILQTIHTSCLRAAPSAKLSGLGPV